MGSTTIAYFLFWTCTILIAYAYFVYPFVVFLISRLFPRVHGRGNLEPTVSMIIAAYNEEKDIKAKLENTLLIDYPPDKLEIIVASDCSSDRTEEIVRLFASRNVRVVRQETRSGKTAAQNLAVEAASGEILLFSDATTEYDSNVLRAILPNFADSSVGCVAGKLLYHDPNETAVGSGARSYWGYETFIKESESLACSLIGASGCLYAVRRTAYSPMYHEACSDFLIATVVYRQGLRTVYEPNAVCFEVTNDDARKEFRMRTRVIAQTISDLWRNRDMLNPLKSGFFAIELISHKLLRYMMPFFLIGILSSSAILSIESVIFRYFLGLQIAFYTVTILGWIIDGKGIRFRPLSLPYYFLLANIASLAGFYKFFKGERYAFWDPIRSKV